MKTITPALAAILMLSAPAAGGAAAETLGATSPSDLRDLLSNGEISYTLIENADGGTPDLQGALKTTGGDINFVVRPKGCQGDPPACDTYIFFANWNLGRDAAPRDFRIANDYNGGRAYGRAYVLETTKQIGVDYTLELKGGVTPDFLRRSQKRWIFIIKSFLAHFSEAMKE